MNIYFDLPQLYYLPQYLPVWWELQSQNIDGTFLFYHDPDMAEVMQTVILRENLPVKWVANSVEAADIYRTDQPDWVIFGNGFPDLHRIPDTTKTAMLYHGAGVKACYFDEELMATDVRFVEGVYRYQKLSAMYPNAVIHDVGFAKLDPLFMPDRRQKFQFNLDQHGLDSSKSTLLYAPTFYPSSIELMADDWPARFSEYNLIVKPHFFTLSKKKYRNQQKKIGKWERYNNTYIARPGDYSLLPFMAVSDLLISEASSAFFEFAALDKPVVWCDFMKLRMGYRGIFKFRYAKRMDADIQAYHDIGIHVDRYSRLKQAVDSQITNPDQFKANRRRYTGELIGETDGKTSKRIVDYLLAGAYDQ